MELSKDSSQTSNHITTVERDFVSINDNKLEHSFIITPTALITHWKPQTLEEIKTDDFAQIIELKPDVVLIGTGATHKQIPQEKLALFYNKQIGVEVMSTPAACRTFNVLAADGRNVVAAILF